MTSTVRRKASEIAKSWHVVDAADRPLGRVATEVATLLRGKHKPTYEPHLDDGDFVVIVNAGQVRLSGRKAEQKVYYRHSGYPGNLRKRTFAEQMARAPERVLERSVWGMLPKGPLGKRMRRHLKVYAGAEHPHQAQITGSERAAEAAAQAAEEALQASIANPTPPPRLRPLSVPETPTPRLTRREKVAAWLAELEEARAAAEADAAAMAEVEDDAPEDDPVAEAEPAAEADAAATAEVEDDLPEEDDAPEDEPVAEAEPAAEAAAADEPEDESEEK
ncbi:MAG: 50S ribosomal protein L13 [Dehalococcoidia bacterium]|nr:50S ribosomal protein L13 [Dehalococcoidia bacterium]MYA52764.1 50S ribosomal protein L13 [Dehalococcoidia bacterium]